MNFFSRNRGRRASVNLDSGDAIVGIIVADGPFRVVIGAGAFIVDGNGRRELAGVVEIPRRRVVWIEVE